jgi:hypothetical protein
MIAELQIEKLNGDSVRSLPIKALPTSENGWPPRPFQIVSLWEMLNRFAQGFYRMGEVMQGLFSSALIYPNADIPRVEKELGHLKSWCELLNLDLSVRGIDWATEELKVDPKAATVSRVLPEVQRRVFDELASIWLIDIPRDCFHCYDNAGLFGEEATNKIANIDTDIAEAGSCFATGRFTACVFHLMRVMERGTQELGNKLGVTFTEEKNWQNILDEINKAIRVLHPVTPQDKAIRDNYSAAAAHLHNVKEAWRNRVMHPKETYTGEEAKAVLDNVRTFIVHLAKNVL